MSKISLIVLSIALGLVIFIVGGGMGIVYQSQMETENLTVKENTPKEDIAKEVIVNVTDKDCVSLVKVLSSGVISSITANGTVTNISGKNITFKFGNTLVTMATTNDTRFFSLSGVINNGKTITETKTSQSKISLKDIKIGDNINLNINVSSDGIPQIKTATVMTPTAIGS